MVTDKGYQGIQRLRRRVLLPHKATRSRPVPRALQALNRAIQRRRVLIEHVFAKLKRFRILASRISSPVFTTLNCLVFDL